SPDSEEQQQRLGYDFAQQELMEKELGNDPIQEAIGAIEKQHEEDKQASPFSCLTPSASRQPPPPPTASSGSTSNGHRTVIISLAIPVSGSAGRTQKIELSGASGGNWLCSGPRDEKVDRG
ncbi:hypothetical protein BaRGS_00019353, partial [Batillaria attramentaria]